MKQLLHTVVYDASTICGLEQLEHAAVISITNLISKASNEDLSYCLRQNASFWKVLGELSMRPEEFGLPLVF